MGHKMKITDGKQQDMHYESRVVHKERECNQQTTHEVGKTGSIRSRSHSRVTSHVHSGEASSKSEHPKQYQDSKQQRRSLTKLHTSSGRRRSSNIFGAPEKRSKSPSKSFSKSRGKSRIITGRERCYDQPLSKRPQPCTRGPKWQTGKYKRDLCGSGIVPVSVSFRTTRGKLWCKTPLSMYQATIGELGRKLLCREATVPRDVRPGPPCNIEEYILPLCRGYYRKYDCLRPCEEEYVTYKQGKKVYRDRVERYWEPCLTNDQKHQLNINTFAPHNVALGLKVRRFNFEVPCW